MNKIRQKRKNEENDTEEDTIDSDDFNPDEDILTVEINGSRKSYFAYTKYKEVVQKYRRLINQVTKTFQEQISEKDQTIELLQNKLRAYEYEYPDAATSSDEIECSAKEITFTISSDTDADEVKLEERLIDAETAEEVEEPSLEVVPSSEHKCNICDKIVSTRRILLVM